MSNVDLDAELVGLRRAREAGDRAAVERHLQAIESALDALEHPLLRGVAYAAVQEALGSPLTAATVLEDLLEAVGDDAVTYYQIGCYRRAGRDLEGAMAAFAKAVEFDPHHVDAWINLGTLLDDRGDPRAALACYREVLRRAPDDFDVWRNLGNSLAALQRFDEAVGAYETALGHKPGDRIVVLLRAATHQARGDIERANATTPAALRADVGEVFEVVDETATPRLVCRFRSPRPERSLGVARQRLAAVRARADLEFGPGPLAFEGMVLVRHDAMILVCDPDARDPARPNRFFDASQWVLQASLDPNPDA